MTIPTPADEALAREIQDKCTGCGYRFDDIYLGVCAQLIAAHVAALAPVNTALPAGSVDDVEKVEKLFDKLHQEFTSNCYDAGTLRDALYEAAALSHPVNTQQ